MKLDFVETQNVKKFYNALSALHRRGAEEACLIVVDGEPGLGKTTTLNHWASQSNGIFLRAKQQWTPNWMLTELIESLGGMAPHSFQKKFAKALELIKARQTASSIDSEKFAIVIDEADYISAKKTLLDTVRDLSDTTFVPAVLVGMGHIRENLIRFPQVNSRVSQRVKFKKATLEDVRLMIDQMCEIKVADDLCKFVHRASGGYNREILNAIASIERIGLRLPSEPDRGPTIVSMSDMVNKPLINDRNTGHEILVPEAY